MRRVHPTHTTRVPGRAAAGALLLAALVLILSGPGAVLGQESADNQPADAGPPADSEGDGGRSTDDPLTFLDSVAVSATLRPAPVRDTPGMVSVIDSETIQERMIEDS